MAKLDQREIQERRKQPPAGDDARERLLAELPVTERRVQLHGVSTALLEGGDGPPVVLLHGPGGHAASWLRVMPNLVNAYRVIAPDLPGQGASKVLDGPFNADRTLPWLGDLIECTCTTLPVLVGHALGGAIAARFASERSERLSALVLVDTLGLAAFQPEPNFGQALSEFIAERQETRTTVCGVSAPSTSTRCATGWVSDGNCSRHTTSIVPVPRSASYPASPHGAVQGYR